MTVFLMPSASAFAAPIPVPNFSFESPPVERNEKNPFGALPFLDDWDETAVGLGDEDDQNTGVFLNTDSPAPDHVTNSHLDRLAFISSLIGNDLRQELVTFFEPGTSYTFTVGVATSFTFPVGATEELEIALFYFDGGVEQVIASNTISGSAVNTTSLVDVTVATPVVELTDEWANQPIGVLIRPLPTDPDDSAGEGFWDADFVRLERSQAAPAISTWGLVTATMLMVATGAMFVHRRSRFAASG